MILWRSSRVWTGEKLAGTLLFPGGLLLPSALLAGEVDLLAVLVIVPIAVAIVLAKRMRARPAQAG